MKKALLSFVLLTNYIVVAQQDSVAVEQSNIQNYTPSKLLEKGKWDIKWFNNLYTQTERTDKGVKKTVDRENYFSTTLEVFTGVSKNKKLNAGIILAFRSNSFQGQSTTSVFDFKNEQGKSRTGLSHFAPSVKIAPFTSLPNFSIQSSVFIPLFEEETNANGFLSENSYIWQNRFFYYSQLIQISLKK